MALMNPKTDGNERIRDDDQLEAEELTAVRHVEVDGKEYKVASTDPYGLWHIRSVEPGSLPMEMRGEFTSPTEAENAIKAFVAAKKHKAQMKNAAAPTINS